MMKERNSEHKQAPNPKELEKELTEFLSQRFGGNVQLVSPLSLQSEAEIDGEKESPRLKEDSLKIDFDLRPEELIAYLDRFITRQSTAKAVLATKICTHFNRIRRMRENPSEVLDLTGSIKNNVLMLGPTGVGKTYMIKLIAKKLAVPFVKGDATKFSETGYVGADVEDLVRDLVKEADGNIELAQYGIIYVDEIDKIASTKNYGGMDVSRTGVQRALLKPMEETNVNLKVPHDPASMMQEMMRLQKQGTNAKPQMVNTKNILFITSGAFAELPEIISKRVSKKGIGFGATLSSEAKTDSLLTQVKTEDLTTFGFESEFVGRLPVRAVFEHLTEEDLYEILANPNNSILLGKKLDFRSYGIHICFQEKALRYLANQASKENTGARGLVSAVEESLLVFETKLPSTDIQFFPITLDAVKNPKEELEKILQETSGSLYRRFEKLRKTEEERILTYLKTHLYTLGDRLDSTQVEPYMSLIAALYTHIPIDIPTAVERVLHLKAELIRIEQNFEKEQGLQISFNNSSLLYILTEVNYQGISLEEFFSGLLYTLELGLNLVKEKTGQVFFTIDETALKDPDAYIGALMYPAT